VQRQLSKEQILDNMSHAADAAVGEFVSFVEGLNASSRRWNIFSCLDLTFVRLVCFTLLHVISYQV
jgi:hypothetical protein